MVDSWEDWEDVDDEQLAKTLLKDDGKKKPVKPMPPANSSQPKVFSDSNLRSLHPYFESQPQFKILSRKTNDPNTPELDKDENQPSTRTDASSKSKTLEEREREYGEARKRIFDKNNVNNQ